MKYLIQDWVYIFLYDKSDPSFDNMKVMKINTCQNSLAGTSDIFAECSMYDNNAHLYRLVNYMGYPALDQTWYDYAPEEAKPMSLEKLKFNLGDIKFFKKYMENIANGVYSSPRYLRIAYHGSDTEDFKAVNDIQMHDPESRIVDLSGIDSVVKLESGKSEYTMFQHSPFSIMNSYTALGRLDMIDTAKFLLVEKDGGILRIGRLDFSKDLYLELKEKYVQLSKSEDTVISPKDFMKSLASLSGSTDNMWSDKYMKMSAVYV